MGHTAIQGDHAAQCSGARVTGHRGAPGLVLLPLSGVAGRWAAHADTGCFNPITQTNVVVQDLRRAGKRVSKGTIAYHNGYRPSAPARTVHSRATPTSRTSAARASTPRRCSSRAAR